MENMIFLKFDYNFASLSSLKRHKSEIHERKKPLNCPLCYATLGTKSALKTHISSIHEGKKFICYYCDNYYKSKNGLNYHISSVHEVGIANSIVQENVPL